MFRATHGYKEEHQHDPPARRNRDFKAVAYGSAKGIPNFKHADPWMLFKNMKDLIHEEENIGVKLFK
jgi:hypothetical protein